MGGTFVIEDDAYHKLAEHIENTFPNEACGILVGNIGEKRICDICETCNLECDRRQSNFSIDPLDIYKLEKANKEVIGFYHSHPNKTTNLSAKDKEYLVPGVLNLVFAVTKNGLVDMKAYKKERPEVNEVTEEQVLVHI